MSEVLAANMIKTYKTSFLKRLACLILDYSQDLENYLRSCFYLPNLEKLKTNR